MLKLDNRDLEILRILSRQGRISKSELAARVNLTPTPCLERLRRLESAGVIKGYRADIELAKIAPHVTVFLVVELTSHAARSFQKFEEAIANCPEITACWALGGGVDYLIQVITRDIDSYQLLIDGLLDAELGIARYFTYIVTKEIKVKDGPSIDHLLGGQAKD